MVILSLRVWPVCRLRSENSHSNNLWTVFVLKAPTKNAIDCIFHNCFHTIFGSIASPFASPTLAMILIISSYLSLGGGRSSVISISQFPFSHLRHHCENLKGCELGNLVYLCLTYNSGNFDWEIVVYPQPRLGISPAQFSVYALEMLQARKCFDISCWISNKMLNILLKHHWQRRHASVTFDLDRHLIAHPYPTTIPFLLGFIKSVALSFLSTHKRVVWLKLGPDSRVYSMLGIVQSYGCNRKNGDPKKSQD